MNSKIDVLVSTTTTKIGRHTKKPTVEVSLSKIKNMIREKKVRVEVGKAYIIYSCGHVFDSEEDPQVPTYFADKGRRLRSCPVCVTEKLLTKYKKCGCGAERISKRIVPSNCCASCPATRRALGTSTTKNAHKHNSDQADPERYFCVYREKCLDKYIEHDTIPCKDCKRYREGKVTDDIIG